MWKGIIGLKVYYAGGEKALIKSDIFHLLLVL